MLSRMKKSQSVTEYAILIALVIAAYAGMQLYVKRGISAKVRDTSEVLSSATGTAIALDVDGYAAGTLGQTRQYEPYYTDSTSSSFNENVGREQLAGGQIQEQRLDRSVTTAGHSGERTMNAVDDGAETVWDNTVD